MAHRVVKYGCVHNTLPYIRSVYTFRIYAVFAKLACYVLKIWAYIENVYGGSQAAIRGVFWGGKGEKGVKHGVLHPQGGGRHVTQVLSGLSVEAPMYIDVYLRQRLIFTLSMTVQRGPVGVQWG